MAVISFNWVTQARQESKQAAADYLQERDLIALRALKGARLKRVARDKRIWGVGVIVACALSAAVSSTVTYNVVVASHDKSTVRTVQTQAQTQRVPPEKKPPITSQISLAIVAPVVATTTAQALIPAPVPAPVPTIVAITTTFAVPAAIQLAGSQSPVTATVPTVAAALPSKPIELPRPQMAVISLPGKAQEMTQKMARSTPSLPALMRPATVAVQKPVVKPINATQATGVSTPAIPNSFVAFSSETPPQTLPNTPIAAQSAQTAPAQASAGFTVVGMPTDKVILIKLQGDETVRPISVGQKLPNGEVLKLVNPTIAVAATDSRNIQLGKN